MLIVGTRYQQVGQHLSVTQYLVGAKIEDMSEKDKVRYEEFLRGKKERGGALRLEVDKS
jgi:hypothetical protein